MEWGAEDKEWLMNRKAGWSNVQARLPALKRIVKRSSWKHLKGYFLYGTAIPPYEDSQIWANDRKLFELWLHPISLIPGEVVYDKIVGSIDTLRTRLQRMYMDILSGLAPEGDSNYGVMGGREQLITLDLNRGVDNSLKIDFGSGELHACCKSPVEIVGHCCNDTMKELRSYSSWPLSTDSWDTYYVAYRPNLVLWDHVSKIVAEDPEWYNVLGMPRENQRFILDAMESVVDYFCLPEHDEARQRKLSSEFAVELLGKFENSMFTDELMKYWDETTDKRKFHGSEFI